jgi:transposase
LFSAFVLRPKTSEGVEPAESLFVTHPRPIREAVQLCLPQARIVADHFHVIQHVCKALGKVIGRCAKKEPGKQASEGHRHLFSRNQENLSASEEESRATLAAPGVF